MRAIRAGSRVGILALLAILAGIAGAGRPAAQTPPKSTQPVRKARATDVQRRLVDGLPIADRMVAHLKAEYGPKPLGDTVLFNIRHGTPDAVTYDQKYRDLGVEPEDHFRMAVPYSSYGWVNNAVARSGNGKAFLPRSVANMQKNAERVFERAIIRALDTGKQLVVVEDGGYIAGAQLRGRVQGILKKLARRPEYRDKVAGLRINGFTEQTTAGERRYREVEGAGGLMAPAFEAASTDLKNEAEGPGVGQTVARALEDWMMPYESLMGKDVVMFGNGKVGEPTVNTMFGRGVKRLTVADKDPNALAKTERQRGLWKELDGRILDAVHPDRLTPEQIRRADVFFDMTGFTTIGKPVIDGARTGAWIASGSSKRNAVDWKYLESRTVKKEKMPWGTAYHLDDGRVLKVVANGEVVNFWKRNASIPSERIDPVYSMLIWGTVTMARNPPSEKKVHTIPNDVQNMLKRWMVEPEGSDWRNEGEGKR